MTGGNSRVRGPLRNSSPVPNLTRLLMRGLPANFQEYAPASARSGITLAALRAAVRAWTRTIARTRPRHKRAHSDLAWFGRPAWTASFNGRCAPIHCTCLEASVPKDSRRSKRSRHRQFCMVRSPGPSLATPPRVWLTWKLALSHLLCLTSHTRSGCCHRPARTGPGNWHHNNRAFRCRFALRLLFFRFLTRHAALAQTRWREAL